MIRIIALAVALGLVLILHLTGVIKANDLSHPFWHVQATMIGAGLGVALTVGLCWLGGRAPGLAKLLRRLCILGLLVALGVTLYAARYFINSADYEPVAGRIWYLGYHATVALFVMLIGTYLPRLINRD
ncbi:hypothetical protein [Roseovarius aestuarii]|uniref:Uncharacterized protein n=1 Tax=Roseovarius aestuarii TaxID=475083 RepID=A0A1X7BP57_9RHOB|nr:hypothetical protein [Roseovarius aestuarii]SMC11310.1 hypothetical protein ROA7745_01122 [Roseovarius aestuarii]